MCNGAVDAEDVGSGHGAKIDERVVRGDEARARKERVLVDGLGLQSRGAISVSAGNNAPRERGGRKE
jgi:hypothetical protein